MTRTDRWGADVYTRERVDAVSAGGVVVLKVGALEFRLTKQAAKKLAIKLWDAAFGGEVII